MKKDIEHEFNKMITSLEMKSYPNESFENGYLEGVEDIRNVFKQEYKTVDQMRVALLRKRDTISNYMLQKVIEKEENWLGSEDHHKNLGFYDALGDGIDSIRNITD